MVDNAGNRGASALTLLLVLLLLLHVIGSGVADVEADVGAAPSVVLQSGQDLNVSCRARTRLESLSWLKDGSAPPRGTVSVSPGDPTSSALVVAGVGAADVGLYECVAAGGAGGSASVLASAYLFVDTGGRRLIAPPSDADRIVSVVAREAAVIPCRWKKKTKKDIADKIRKGHKGAFCE